VKDYRLFRDSLRIGEGNLKNFAIGKKNATHKESHKIPPKEDGGVLSHLLAKYEYMVIL